MQKLNLLIILFVCYSNLNGWYNSTKSYYPDLSTSADLVSVKLRIVDEFGALGGSMSNEQVLVQSLQGCMARCAPLGQSEFILIRDTSTVDSFASVMNVLYGVTVESVSIAISAYDLIDQYKSCVTGQEYVTYDDHGEHMLAALSLAGLYGILAVHTSNESAVQAKGFTKRTDFDGQTYDLSGNAFSRTKAWSIYSIHPLANKKLMIEQTDGNGRNYDIGVAVGSWVFHIGGPGSENHPDRLAYFDWLEMDARVLGWNQGGDERLNFGNASARGVTYTPADWSMNLSTYITLSRKVPLSDKRVPRIYKKTLRDLKWENNVRYVALRSSDGDNIQLKRNWSYWFSSSEDGTPENGIFMYFNDPDRGTYPHGHGICSSKTEIFVPPLARLFHSNNLADLTTNDSFLFPASGDGVSYLDNGSSPNNFGFGALKGGQISAFQIHAEHTVERMKLLNINITEFMLANDVWNQQIFDWYVPHTERLAGIFVTSYGCGYQCIQDRGAKWTTDKNGLPVPALACVYSYWKNDLFGTTTAIAAGINGELKNPDDDRSYFLVNLHMWCDEPVKKGKEIVNLLNSDSRVVNPEELFLMMRVRSTVSRTQTQTWYTKEVGNLMNVIASIPAANPAAEAVRTQANYYLSQAIAASNISDWEGWFTNTQMADTLSERARLSIPQLILNGGQLTINIADHRELLCGWTLDEVDPAYSTVKWFHIEIYSNVSNVGGIPLWETYTTNTVISLPLTNFIRVQAKGAFWGETGEWAWVSTQTITLVSNVAASNLNTGLVYSNIQTAVNGAFSGQTIIVFPGAYNEEVTVSKDNINIVAKSWFDSNDNTGVVIDGASSNQYCFYLNNANNVKIEGFSILGAVKNGIRIDGSSSDNFFAHNSIYSNLEHGLRLNGDGADNNFIVSNSLWGNSSSGILFEGGDNNIVISNSFFLNNEDGIFFGGPPTSGNFLALNLVYSNSFTGISLPFEDDDQNIFFSNEIFANGLFGFNINAADNNKFFRNLIRDNVQHGIYLDGSAESNEIVNNTFHNNGQNGIALFSGASAVIYNNIFTSNGLWGVYNVSTASISHGYNLFSGNLAGSVSNDGGLILTGSNITANPVYTNYFELGPLSPGIDGGTNYPAVGGYTGLPDIGWRERDTVPPSVTVNKTVLQAEMTSTLPILFQTLFSEIVTGLSFGDFIFSGSASGISGTLSGSGSNYILQINTVTGEGTVIPSLLAGTVQDLVGMPNTASTSSNNSVVYFSNLPSVSIEQAVGQSDPTASFPIEFSVIFNQAVSGLSFSNFSFTGSAGSPAGSLIQNNLSNYSLYITSLSMEGSIKPSLTSNQVTNFLGILNPPSTGVDNSVTYDTIPPTVSIISGPSQDTLTNESFHVQLLSSENFGFWSTNGGLSFTPFSETVNIFIIANTNAGAELHFYGSDGLNTSPTNKVTYNFYKEDIFENLRVLPSHVLPDLDGVRIVGIPENASELYIYNMNGELIAWFNEINKWDAEGRGILLWDLNAGSGNRIESGIYIVTARVRGLISKEYVYFLVE